MANTEPAAPTAPTFTPVAFRARKDGWTADKQIQFIANLTATGCVKTAAKSVGMSK